MPQIDLSSRPIVIGALLLVYGGAFVAFQGLRFEARKDETHFWPTSVSFSRALPDLEALRGYDEGTTPLAFVVFGALEGIFHGGIFLGRLLNFSLSFAIACLVALSGGKARLAPALAALGLLVFPYYLFTSTHLYTDILAAFFAVLGVAWHRQGRHLLSSLAFVLGIATRQHLVAFPAAIAAWELLRFPDEGQGDAGRFPLPRLAWIAPALAASSILAWIWLFGGLVPPLAARNHPIPSAEPLRVFPDHALYFLACVGLYFVLVELALFRDLRVLQSAAGRRTVPAACALGVLFLCFPPLGNVDYPIAAMGALDRAARAVLGDALRLFLFWTLALMTCLRFQRLTCASMLVFVNALVMTKAHIGWDKYALPLLAGLWYLKAAGAEEEGRPEAEEAAPPPAAAPQVR